MTRRLVIGSVLGLILGGLISTAWVVRARLSLFKHVHIPLDTNAFLTLEQVSYGTNAALLPRDPWKAALWQHLPSWIRDRTTPPNVVAQNSAATEHTLTLWTQYRELKESRWVFAQPKLSLNIVDDSGTRFPLLPLDTEHHWNEGHIALRPWVTQTFPRSAARLTFEIVDRFGKVAGTASLPNPFRYSHSPIPPSPAVETLPARRQSHGCEFILESFELSRSNSAPIARLRVQTPDGAPAPWRLWNQFFLDSLGNTSSVVSPSDPVWTLQTEWIPTPTANFDPKDRVLSVSSEQWNRSSIQDWTALKRPEIAPEILRIHWLGPGEYAIRLGEPVSLPADPPKRWSFARSELLNSNGVPEQVRVAVPHAALLLQLDRPDREPPMAFRFASSAGIRLETNAYRGHRTSLRLYPLSAAALQSTTGTFEIYHLQPLIHRFHVSPPPPSPSTPRK